MTDTTPLVTQSELEEMQDAWGERPTEPSGFVLIQEEMIDQRRWVTLNNRIFRTADGRFLSYNYETPSTEYQEGSETEVEPSDVFEVFPHEVLQIVYKRTPASS